MKNSPKDRFWKLEIGDETITPLKDVEIVSPHQDGWEEEVWEEPEPLPPPKRASWGGVLFWLFGGVFGLYVFVQGIGFYQTVMTLPLPLQIGAWSIFALLLGVVFVALIRLTWFYGKLQSNRQQYLTYEATQNRMRSWQAQGDLAENQKKIGLVLHDFVRRYPLENFSTHPLLLKTLVWGKKKPEEMVRLGEFLRQTSPNENPEYWLEKYQQFQAILDTTASHSLEKAAKIVGIKTAISPNPLWDMLIVLYWSFHFTRELCGIYHLRVNGYATCRLVTKMWVTAICSSAVDSMEDTVQVGMEHFGQTLTSNKLITAIFGQAATKTASGMANYYLFRRLGKAAVEQIRPLTVKNGE
ncbi:MAG: DUF697 domain-containing protein [Planctomycetia bacterium]|nr:DUF697 domain-containing protein [Planctomycetia bacterium]